MLISRKKHTHILQESFDDVDKTQTPTKNEPENDLDMDVTSGVTPVKKPSTSVESMLRFLGSKEEVSPKKGHDDTNYEPIEEESDFDDHDNAGEGTSRRSKRLLESPEISIYAKKPKVMIQIGGSPKKPIQSLFSNISTSTPIAGRNISYIPMVKSNKSPSKVIVPLIRKKKMPQEDPKIFRSYVRLERCDAAIALKKKLREKTERKIGGRFRKRARDLDESDSDIETPNDKQPVLGEVQCAESEKLLNQGVQHIWNLEFENLKKKFEMMQAQLEAERAEKEKLAQQIQTLKTGELICFNIIYLVVYFSAVWLHFFFSQNFY